MRRSEKYPARIPEREKRENKGEAIFEKLRISITDESMNLQIEETQHTSSRLKKKKKRNAHGHTVEKPQRTKGKRSKKQLEKKEKLSKRNNNQMVMMTATMNLDRKISSKY